MDNSTHSYNFEPYAAPLDVLYEDDYLLAVDKPSGLLVHPTVQMEPDTLGSRVLYYYAQHSCPAKAHPVSRLDRYTSGLVIFVKEPSLQAKVLANMQQKIYLGITDGIPNPTEGIIDAPIARKEGSIIEREVNPIGKTAQTKYRTILASGDKALVAFRLITGRTHQIRVHAAHLCTPIYGDGLYGKVKAPPARHYLHAYALCLTHPVTAEPLTIFCAPPLDFTEVMKTAGISYRYYFCALRSTKYGIIEHPNNF